MERGQLPVFFRIGLNLESKGTEMRTQLKTLAAAAALVAGLAVAPAVYAHQSQGPRGSMMGGGGMMGQMNEMMGTCNKMMQGMMKDHDSEKPKVQSPNPDSTK